MAFSSPSLAASPDAKPWNLQYRLAANAPSNCPDEETIHMVLGARLDKPHSFQKDAARSISVDVAPKSGHVEALIVARDENGSITTNQTLTIPAWRCDLMAERIVFVLREVIEPLELPPIEAESKPAQTSAAREEPQATEASKPHQEKPLDVPAPTAKDTAAPARSSKFPKLVLSLGGGSAWWNAPKTALSTTIGVEAQWQRVSLGIEGHYDYAWAVPDVAESRANRAGAALVACAFQPWLKRYYLRACALGTFTQMSFDLPLRNSPEQSAPMVDLGARFGFGAWLSSSVGVELRADATFVLMRPYVYVQHDRVWRIAPFTGALRLAFVGAFDVF